MNRIKQIRQEHKIRQADLAKELSITQGTLSNWESGRHEPDIDAVTRLSDYFGVSIDYLLGRSSFPKTVEEVISSIDTSAQNMNLETLARLQSVQLTEQEDENIRKYIDFVLSQRKQD